MITTPFGNRASMISRAKRKASLKSGVRRLSGGLEKVRRYTFGDGLVQMKLPLTCTFAVGGDKGICTTNNGGIGAMVSDRRSNASEMRQLVRNSQDRKSCGLGPMCCIKYVYIIY